MAFTVDWAAHIVYSDTSITDLPVAHLELRALEASTEGMMYPKIISWQKLVLAGGAQQVQIDFNPLYSLQFIGPGPFVIQGNLNAVINDTGVQVDRRGSIGYVTTSVGAEGATPESIALAVRNAIATELARIDVSISSRSTPADTVLADVRKLNGTTIAGDGSDGNPWRALQ